VVERTRTGYRRLLEIRVLHHYWLDDGATTFDDIADAQLRARRLLRYDARQFLGIAPSSATASRLAGLGGAFRTTGLGCVVAVPEDVDVGTGGSLDFFLTPVAGQLAAYTAMSLRPQPVVEVLDPASGRARRYKEGTPVLSNLTGAARTRDGTKHLYLSSDYPTGTGDRVEELVAAGGQLRQLTSDPPAPTVQQLGPTADLPVFVHQGDAPVVVPPAGVVGAPARGIELTDGVPDAVLAVLRLSPVRTDDDDFSFVDGTGRPRAQGPVFEVHLKNRSTTWRYRRRGDGSVLSTEAQPLPLTYFGNAGTKRKPTPGAIEVDRDPNSPSRVVRVVSEIFV
jgi:hypothetical protein